MLETPTSAQDKRKSSETRNSDRRGTKTTPWSRRGEFLTKEIQLLAQSSANQLEKERIDSPNRFEGSSVEKCCILTDANPKFIEKRGADNISRELKEPLSLSKQENAGGPHGPVEFDEQVEMLSELRSTAWSKDPANEFQVKMGDSTMQEQSNPLVMFAQLVPLARQKSSRPTRRAAMSSSEQVEDLSKSVMWGQARSPAVNQPRLSRENLVDDSPAEEDVRMACKCDAALGELKEKTSVSKSSRGKERLERTYLVLHPSERIPMRGISEGPCRRRIL